MNIRDGQSCVKTIYLALVAQIEIDFYISIIHPNSVTVFEILDSVWCFSTLFRVYYCPLTVSYRQLNIEMSSYPGEQFLNGILILNDYSM